jgi:hypothetical protein
VFARFELSVDQIIRRVNEAEFVVDAKHGYLRYGEIEAISPCSRDGDYSLIQVGWQDLFQLEASALRHRDAGSHWSARLAFALRSFLLTSS